MGSPDPEDNPLPPAPLGRMGAQQLIGAVVGTLMEEIEGHTVFGFWRYHGFLPFT